MRLEQIPVNVSLAAMLPVALAIFATRKALLKSFAVTFSILVVLDLIANLTGLGPFFWWSPLHWPSAIALGVDEIVENHGVVVTTIGYVADIFISAIVITAVVQLLKRKRKTPNQTSDATSEPAPGADSSAHQG
jgi:hypothetical protein